LASEDSRYCVECGARLEPEHRFCWSCGTPRWIAPEQPPPTPEEAPAPDLRPPPPPPPSVTPAGRGSAAAADLGLLPWLYAAGAVFFLVWTTQALAYFLAPAGRSQLSAELARQGVPASGQPALLVVYGGIVIGITAVAAGLHGAAFYGLRRRRRWGWLSAVVVAGFWSLLIVGVPVLLRLVNRNVRRAFGVD
jgi:hypothetical protein